jgi:hypothetical protein
VVEQPKQRLLLAPEMRVESPRKESLRSHHQTEVGIHATSSRRSIKPSAARRKFVEPDRT